LFVVPDPNTDQSYLVILSSKTIYFSHGCSKLYLVRVSSGREKPGETGDQPSQWYQLLYRTTSLYAGHRKCHRSGLTIYLHLDLGKDKPDLVNPESVPFRLTPNLQVYITPIGLEGVLSSAIMSMAKSLSLKEVGLYLEQICFYSNESGQSTT
jgi:hypothetical protein